MDLRADQAANALSWWIEAGVDTIVDEAPRDWLKAPAEAAPAAAAEPAADPLARDEPMPDGLAEFQAWLMASATLPLAAAGAPRLGPQGDPDGGLMVLIDMPSQADLAAGKLLTGEAGSLFDNMMKAIGRGRDSLYLAALSPVRTPTGRLAVAEAAAIAPVALHHVGLVRPKALLMFGEACAKALFGGSVQAKRGRWHQIETPSGPVKALVTFRPDDLLRTTALKQPAWEDLKMLRNELAQ
ncbi:MAG: uracil-DNA glycosylase family protein [Sphingosinicella sp.]